MSKQFSNSTANAIALASPTSIDSEPAFGNCYQMIVVFQTRMEG